MWFMKASKPGAPSPSVPSWLVNNGKMDRLAVLLPLEPRHGWETAQVRLALGLHKTPKKAERSPASHAVDSGSLISVVILQQFADRNSTRDIDASPLRVNVHEDHFPAQLDEMALGWLPRQGENIAESGRSLPRELAVTEKIVVNRVGLTVAGHPGNSRARR